MRHDERPHGVAWWLWAGGLAVAALKTSNPILLVGLGAVAAVVAVARRSDAPWGRSIGTFVRLGIVVILLRVVLQLIFGERVPGHVLFTIPSVPLPSWAEGVSIGGPVTLEGVLSAVVEGLRLAVVLVCFGAANSLASPREVLRSLPAVLHEVAVAITVAMCFAPEVMAAVLRVRQARRLRGRPVRGIAGFRGIAVPVLEDALEHSTQLAASMGSRGFGRAAPTPSPVRSRASFGAVALGALAALAGGYGLLVAGSPVPGAPFLALAGVAAVGVGVLINGRRSARTRYRPAPFGWRSVGCSAAGWFAALAVSIAGVMDPGAVGWTPYPLTWPEVPPLALFGVLVALAPLALAPSRTPVRRPISEAAVTT